jgi:hypothetical protein
VQLRAQTTGRPSSADLVLQIRAACLYVEAERRISEVLSRTQTPYSVSPSTTPSTTPQIPSGSTSRASPSTARGVPQSLVDQYKVINNFIESLRSGATGDAGTYSSTPIYPPEHTIVAEALAHGAIVRMFRPFIDVSADARATVMRSSIRVVTLMESAVGDTFATLDPIAAVSIVLLVIARSYFADNVPPDRLERSCAGDGVQCEAVAGYVACCRPDSVKRYSSDDCCSQGCGE